MVQLLLLRILPLKIYLNKNYTTQQTRRNSDTSCPTKDNYSLSYVCRKVNADETAGEDGKDNEMLS